MYPPDPVNDFDLSGDFGLKSFANLAGFASMIPGPVGMVASGVSAVAYAAAGDKKAAALACAGIALAAVGAGSAVVAYKASRIASAARAGEDLAKFGKVGKLTSNIAGKMYVGRGAQKIPLKQGYRYLSSDGLRGYRGAAFKVKQKTYQSNFEAFRVRPTSGKKFKAPNRYYNGHLNIRR